MAEGYDRHAWNHTSALIATLVNINRDPKKPVIPVARFHPYETGPGRGGTRITRSNIELLKAFVPNGGRKQ